MSDPQHPAFEDIADLSEGLLGADGAATVQAHLDECAECGSVVEALGNVSLLLADAGSTAPMPELVASRLDDALDRAQAERAAGVVSLTDRRATSSSDKPSRTSAPAGTAGTGSARGGDSSGVRQRRPGLLIGGAAAAAALVISVGAGRLLLDGFDSGTSVSSAEDNSAGQAGPEFPSAPEAASGGADADTESTNKDAMGNGAAPSPAPGRGESDQASPRLNPDNLVIYASRLDRAAPNDLVPLASQLAGYANRCATLSQLRRKADESQTFTAARWRGQRALVSLDAAASRVSVYDCETPPNLLYSTGY